MDSTSLYVPRVSSSCLLTLQEAPQGQKIDLTQASFKLLLQPCAPENVKFCVLPLRLESLFPTASGSLETKLC